MLYRIGQLKIDVGTLQIDLTDLENLATQCRDRLQSILNEMPDTSGIMTLLNDLKSLSQEISGKIPPDVSGQLDTIISSLGSLAGYVDGLEGLLTDSNSKLDGLSSGISQVQTLITQTNNSLQTVIASVDGLEDLLSQLKAVLDSISGYVDGLEGLLSASNSKLDVIAGYVDGLEGKLDSIASVLGDISGYVDGLETLIAQTNGWLDDIFGALGQVQTLITQTNNKLDTLGGYVDGLEQLLTDIGTKLQKVSDNLAIAYSGQSLIDNKLFMFSQYITLNNGVSQNYLLKTGAKAVMMRLWLAGNTVNIRGVQVQLFEDSVVSANGTIVSVLNQKRSGSGSCSVSVYSGPTITSDGNNIVNTWFTEGVMPVLILKPNANYILRITAYDNGTRIGIIGQIDDSNW